MEFPASELILHPDGSIYHLGLLPEDISDTIITVGDPERVKQISKYFDRIEVKKSYREFVTHTGRLGRKRLTIVSTGIGTDNIDIVLNELDALANIDLQNRTVKPKHTALNIIRIGTSGSMQKEIPVDTFLKSAFSIGIDSLMHFYKYTPKEADVSLLESFQKHNASFDLNPYISSANEDLLDAIGPEWLEGVTLTCPGFYAPQGRRLRYELKHDGYLDRIASWREGKIRATNFEMETSAIYALSQLLGHKAISLNAIVANRPSGTFSKDPKQTVEKLIEQSLEFIEKL